MYMMRIVISFKLKHSNTTSFSASTLHEQLIWLLTVINRLTVLAGIEAKTQLLIENNANLYILNIS